MLIACIVIIALFVVFILTTYLISMKTAKFEVEGKELKVHNQGSKLSIFYDNKLILKKNMPQLIQGESFDVPVNDKIYIVKCQSNGFGNKIRIELFDGNTLLSDNGVKLKPKKIEKLN